MGKYKRWSRLDNAAKIFPPTSSSRDTKVFRFVCELAAPVNPDLLQQALEQTLEDFPLFCSVLRKGLFWYYFEESSLLPIVTEETLPVCSPLYHPDKPDLLFRVSYFGKRINLEVFHALSDGTGAMQFLRTMVYYYLARAHGFSGHLPDYDAARDQKDQDAFYQYYDKSGPVSKKPHRRAFRIKGERLPFDQIGITEGILSLPQILRVSREHEATLSEFLVSVLIASVYDGMAVQERTRPVVITVPVNLRRFFPAQTARNFFGVIQVAHSFQKDGADFTGILHTVRESFRSQVSEENLQNIITRYAALEHHLLIKPIPLEVKNPFLRLASRRAESEDTAAFSNVGQVSMPPETMGHIRLFDLYVSTKRPQICLCSFGDTLAVSISSPFADTRLQRHFFRRLTAFGCAVQIVSNLEQLQRGDQRAEKSRAGTNSAAT